MPESDDIALLKEYAESGSEAAFTALVERHVNLVYSAALRSVGNPHAAQEIAQAVFIILARKAGQLPQHTVLSGWLYQTARLTAANYLRGEIRRQRREQEAYMQSILDQPDGEAWRQIAPLLDDAMDRLGEKDRNAIVLRFFENKNLSEVGAALGASEDAAKMRVNRALEKLRKFFTKRGVALSGTIIAGAVSANSVHAAPAALAKTISAVAVAKGAAASGLTLTLVKGALKIMAWTKAKTVIVASACVLLAAGTTTVAVRTMARPSLTSNPSWANDSKYWRSDTRVLDKNPPAFILRPTRFSYSGNASLSGPKGEKLMTMNVGIQSLLADAYSASANRMVLPDNLPKEHFDLMLTLPDNPRGMLQQELKRRFGLTAHRETRDTDVLVLKVRNPNASGLRLSASANNGGGGTPLPAGRVAQLLSGSANNGGGLSAIVNNGGGGSSSFTFNSGTFSSGSANNGGGGSSSSSSGGGAQEITMKNQEFSGFADSLEGRFGKPVINQTDLNGRYDIHLQWKSQPGESDNEGFKQALLDQLGLELVPATRPIEKLVVEKVKN